MQPEILLNERNGAPYHVAISEQNLRPKEGRWEAAITLNRNWGYHAGDNRWKEAAEVIRALLEVRSEGGNLLLNAGPRADGTIPDPCRRVLAKVGQWMESQGSSLRGSLQRSLFSWNNSVLLVARPPEDTTVLVFVLEELHPDFRLCEFRNQVSRVFCPAEDREIIWRQDDDGALHFDNAPTPQDGLPICLEVSFAGPLEPFTPRGQHWIVP